MSRRKAGYVPRRVDPEPNQDDMETPEFVIDVKPERDTGALAPKDVSMPGPLGTERTFGTAPLPLGARSPWARWIPLSPEPSGESPVLPVRIGTLRWVSLYPGTRLASLALAPACIETLGWLPTSLPRDPPDVPSLRPCVYREPRVGTSLPPGPPGVPSPRSSVHRNPPVGTSLLGMAPDGLASPTFPFDLRVSPLYLGALTPRRAPPHHSPPASSLQTASPGPTSTQIC